MARVPPLFERLATAGESAPTPVRKPYDLFYSLNPSRWYETYPFYFDIVDTSVRDGDPQYHQLRFFLPIPPQNMTVQDMSTSEAHATIGGVVEETSKAVFSMITMTGTTGLSSYASDLSTSKDSSLVVAYRKYLDDLTGESNVLTKFIGGAIGAVTNLAAGLLGDAEAELPYGSAGSAVTSSNSSDPVTSLKIDGKGKSKLGGFDAFTEKITNSFSTLFGGGVGTFNTPFANGFTWSHALRQLFLVYQAEKSSNQNLALYFVDAKANTKYRCVVRSAQFTQNAKDPYIISYNISLKCWSLGNLESGSVFPIDRFGPDGDLKEVYTANITASITSIGNTLRKLQRPSSIAGGLVKNSTSSIL